MRLSILYRGPLASCNYACWYCPFAKKTATPDERAADREALECFVAWVAGRQERFHLRPWWFTISHKPGRSTKPPIPRPHPPLCRGRGGKVASVAPSRELGGGLGRESGVDQLSIFFTPWGEALIWPRYQQAIARLSHMPHVDRVVIQTNLSCPLDWVADCNPRSLALWATYHPSEVARGDFLSKVDELDRRGIRFSVGMVGMREHIAEIEAMRAALPSHLYLWVNAYKHGEHYYTPEHLQRLAAVDPLFPINNQRHPSLGRSCRCGHTVIAVDGAGTIRRCHFIREPLGNLYEPDFERVLERRPCTNETCGCYIGYVHMEVLGLYEVFGAGVLERIPACYLTQRRKERKENRARHFFNRRSRLTRMWNS